MSIARFAVSRRVTVTMMAAAIIVLGIFAFPRLPIDLLPSFQPPIVSVTVNYGNVAPETMESVVTRPIENAVARVSGIDYLQSNSFQGQSIVRAVFKYGTDINVASTDIQQQIARISNQLPNDPNLQPPQILKADPNALPVVFLYITDTMRTQRDLNDLFSNALGDEFSAIPGVGSATTSGGQTRALMVEPDQTQLAGYGLTNLDIINKLANENVDAPAGIIAIGPNEFGIRTSALYKSAAEIANTVVTVKNGAPIYLGDIARVSDSIEEQRVFARLDGVPAIRLAINAQPDANVVSVANGIDAKIAELERRYTTMHFQVVFEQRGFIVDAVTALGHTALYGAVLAVLIILLFLHTRRSTLIVAVSLPVSAMGTLFALYVNHQTLNTMTLGALALAVGLIVDDAVVVIENIFRHLDEGAAPIDAARDATAQIMSAVFSSSITVVTVFVPLLLIPGLQGLIFGPFALTVMTAVAISFFVAVTTVPMLSSVFLSPKDAHAGGRFAARFDALYLRFENRYRAVLGWAIDRPLIVLGVSAALLLLTLLSLRLGIVQTEVFPASDSRYARFDIRTANGTSLDATNRVSRIIESAFRGDSRVQSVGATVGSAFGGGTSRPISNQTSLSVTLRPDVQGPRATAFVAEWQRRLGGLVRAPRGSSAASAPLTATDVALRRILIGATIRGRTIDILQQQITQGSDDMTIQIFGPDIARLYALAKGAIAPIGQIPGVIQPDTNITDTQPEVDVRIDRRKAAEYGFSTGDVAADIATVTSGTVASYYQINGVQYPILVEAPPAERRSFPSIADLLLTPPTALAGASAAVGAAAMIPSIPLRSLAAITTGVGPSQIPRQNKQRRVDVDASVIDEPLGQVVAAAQDVMDRYPLPAGYHWRFGPNITQNTDTFRALALVVFLAIVLIYMLLASQFESFVDPLVIMTAVPLASIGIVGSLALTHRSFGLTAFIGSLMLVGIAVKNAILVVEFTKQMRRSGMNAREALLHAGPRRLRPILMTTFATAGGMLPLALGLETGSATQAPLGTVVIGGLVTSTLLSLIVVPTLYMLTVRYIEPRFTRRPPSWHRRIIPPPSMPEREPAGV